MDYIEVLGLAAAFFTTVANLPQAIKVIKTREVKNLSILSYAMLFLGLALWVGYGFTKSDLPIIIGNSIAAILCAIILIMKIICRNEPQNEVTA